ncbi:MAG: hypothetical protein ACK5U8_15525, partial [Deltaproteobacteria bacterium]
MHARLLVVALVLSLGARARAQESPSPEAPDARVEPVPDSTEVRRTEPSSTELVAVEPVAATPPDPPESTARVGCRVLVCAGSGCARARASVVGV